MSFGYLCNISAALLLKTYFFVNIIVEVGPPHASAIYSKEGKKEKKLRKSAFWVRSTSRQRGFQGLLFWGHQALSFFSQMYSLWYIYNSLLPTACNTVSSAKYLTTDLTLIRTPSRFWAAQAPKFRHGLNTPLLLAHLGARITKTEECGDNL